MNTQTSYIAERPALANRFTVIDTLGEGASSSVYLVADSKRGGEHVALKVLQNDTAFDEHTMKRFTAELEVCKEIKHPNIVQAYDLIDLGDTIAFTMEFVRGADLLELFRHSERLSNEEIDRIFIEILEALQQLHERDIVHRDLKLENVLIREDGMVKLSDLGLMKRLDRDGLTKPGLLLGTVHYMPPEYITGGEYDERGDLYGVAIMLLELVTKKRRLASLEGREVIQELIRTRFVIPEQRLLEIPRKYRTIIRKGTAIDIHQRYQNAAEMIADFKKEFSDFISGDSAHILETIDVDGVTLRHGARLGKGRGRGRYWRLMQWVMAGLFVCFGMVLAAMLFLL
ncbi:MAG: serine/threonine protein kinase [Bdellovibrionales bacterium]|nr:serine/threonine protein kinase [Bdellovibrionales bacterium]